MSVKILIPLCLDPVGAAQRHYVYGTYLKRLLHYGLLPVLVSPLYSDAMIGELFAECSGLLLTGGVDVEPSRYGAERHAMTEPSVPERDQLELKLLGMFRAARKPVLGICRGAQLIAVESGGSLHQHIPDLGLDELHGTSEVQSSNDLFRACRHEIKIEPGSSVAAILGADTCSVNSAHHQAIHSVGPSLRVAARSRAGVIEIIESAEKEQFLLGIQAHPEADLQATLEPLVGAFAQAATMFRSAQ